MVIFGVSVYFVQICEIIETPFRKISGQIQLYFRYNQWDSFEWNMRSLIWYTYVNSNWCKMFAVSVSTIRLSVYPWLIRKYTPQWFKIKPKWKTGSKWTLKDRPFLPVQTWWIERVADRKLTVNTGYLRTVFFENLEALEEKTRISLIFVEFNLS